MPLYSPLRLKTIIGTKAVGINSEGENYGRRKMAGRLERNWKTYRKERKNSTEIRQATRYAFSP